MRDERARAMTKTDKTAIFLPTSLYLDRFCFGILLHERTTRNILFDTVTSPGRHGCGNFPGATVYYYMLVYRWNVWLPWPVYQHTRPFHFYFLN